MMKTVLITGADRGIGYSLCECFIEGGWYVIAGQYMPEWPQLSALAEKYPEQLAVIPLAAPGYPAVRHMKKCARYLI